MFERFSDGARRVVAGAHEEARALRHDCIGSEHLLLALVRNGESVAAQLLDSVGVTESAVREQLAQMTAVGAPEPSGHIPFTTHSKRVLEQAMRECRDLADDVIGTEHLLLGMLADAKSAGAQLIGTLSGMDEPRLQQHMRGKLAEHRTTHNLPAREEHVVHVRLTATEHAACLAAAHAAGQPLDLWIRGRLFDEPRPEGAYTADSTQL